jgi:hypothetical protein
MHRDGEVARNFRNISKVGATRLGNWLGEDEK